MVIGWKAKILSVARKILSMDIDIAKHCDGKSVKDKDSEPRTN